MARCGPMASIGTWFSRSRSVAVWTYVRSLRASGGWRRPARMAKHGLHQVRSPVHRQRSPKSSGYRPWPTSPVTAMTSSSSGQDGLVLRRRSRRVHPSSPRDARSTRTTTGPVKPSVRSASRSDSAARCGSDQGRRQDDRANARGRVRVTGQFDHSAAADCGRDPRLCSAVAQNLSCRRSCRATRNLG